MPLERHLIEMDGGRTVTAPATLDGVFDGAVAHDGPVVVHFHGGLVGRSKAVVGAPGTVEAYGRAGAYAIVPVWRTGVLEVLADSWLRIAGEALFKVLIDRVAGLAHAHLAAGPGGRGTVDRTLPEVTDEVMVASAEGRGDFPAVLDGPRLPEGTDVGEPRAAAVEALELELLADRRLTAEFDAAARGAGLEVPTGARGLSAAETLPPKPTLADHDVLRSLQGDASTRGLPLAAAKFTVNVVLRVVGRYAARTHHGLHATVVEEVLRALYFPVAGRTVWDEIKGYTRKAFEGEAPEYGGTALLEGLARIPAERRVVLVGHSAGTVFIAELLRRARGLGRTFEVVFLAPAIRMDEFAAAVVGRADLLTPTPSGPAFRVFTMSDEYEAADTLVRLPPPVGELKAFYPRSLLYFVSGLCEPEVDAPLLGMQRFFDPGHWAARDQGVAESVRFCEGRTVWSVAEHADDRLRASSSSHSGFGEPIPGNETMESVLSLVRRGWA